MTRQTRQALIIGICSFLATAGIATAHQASAANRRTHSSVCHTTYDNEGTSVINASYYNAVSGTKYVYCPIESDTTLAHGNVTTINVHGYEAANGDSYSRACAKNYAGNGTSCGSTKYWGSTYTGAIGVDVSGWSAEPAWFPYMYNRLINSSIFGIYTAN